ncbi:hypothetical protein GIB67_027571 [Kingdonia uniflora]|uniref:Uncharacterized protein n=1 Tax=Kingdonia uniflora TaxID=39325 RepID=A0A7J7NL26_9MAGN|nr:hypothetical protein GIB67_027571 [Kingdonia uniflora]
MGKDWCEFKVEKRKLIDINDEYEQALEKCPEDVPYNQWEAFVKQCTTYNCKVSDDEVAFLAHGDANDENNVLSLWYDGRVNGFAVKTVDTTGAGDAFVGDFFLPYQRMKLTPHTDMGIGHLQHVLEISPGNVAAYFGLASRLLGLSKECVNNGAFCWGALLLKETSDVTNASTVLTGKCFLHLEVHIEELEGALNSASNMIETMSSHFQSFLPKKLPFTLVNPARGSERNLDELQTEINVSCKRINKEFGYTGYEPIVYIDKPLSISEGIAFYSIAECVVVSAIRDGMNLTPYEYIVCRQGVSGLGSGSDSSGIKKSMLVVSEFVGCSPSLSGAIRINLWNIKTIGEALNEAISMAESKKQLLHEKHYRYVAPMMLPIGHGASCRIWREVPRTTLGENVMRWRLALVSNLWHKMLISKSLKYLLLN